MSKFALRVACSSTSWVEHAKCAFQDIAEPCASGETEIIGDDVTQIQKMAEQYKAAYEKVGYVCEITQTQPTSFWFAHAGLFFK